VKFAVEFEFELEQFIETFKTEIEGSYVGRNQGYSEDFINAGPKFSPTRTS
jgi:hypothetical protein